MRDPLVGGAPGDEGRRADDPLLRERCLHHDPAAALLGSTVTGPGPHTLHVDAAGLPAGSRVALVSNRTQGQAAPIQLGTVAEDGTFSAAYGVAAPARPGLVLRRRLSGDGNGSVWE